MFGDRLLPAGVSVDRLGVGSQLQGGEPQDLPVNLQGRLLGKSAEHAHEGNLVRETQPIVVAPPQGDLAAVGLEKAGIANQTGAGRRRGRRPARFCQEQNGCSDRRPKGSLSVSRLDGKEDDIRRRFLELGVSKTAIAKITGVCPVRPSTAS